MAKQYVHYQEYFKSFLGGWSFENGDETLTIKEVKEEEMYDAQTQGKMTKLCVWFAEKDLPMVLNVTNADTIAGVVGSDRLEDWVGKKVIVGQSKIKAFGNTKIVIRVRNEKPRLEEAAKATDDQIRIIYELVNNGKITSLEAMLKHYKVASVEDMSITDAQQVIDTKSGG